MLPLLVETDVADEAGKPDGNYPYLAGLLRAAVNEERAISVPLTRALLRSGRVLVVTKPFGRIEKTVGALLVATGVLFLTGGFHDMSLWLIETFPQFGQVG